MLLYIVLFLHQTTTTIRAMIPSISCISFFSYIKPQLRGYVCGCEFRCISFFSYIKPQLFLPCNRLLRVVYRSFPTSNHNRWAISSGVSFVVYRSFPTSNHNSINWPAYSAWVVYRSFPTSNHNYALFRYVYGCISFFSYIKPQLSRNIHYLIELYIVLFLHQTTTNSLFI